MKILVFDTCCGTCSVAIFREHRLIASNECGSLNMQAERLLPMLNESLATAKLKYKDLDAIVVTIGPGSFTGIRTGLATAYAICSAANLPIIGVSMMELLVFINFTRKEEVCVTVAAGRNRFYCQKFSMGDTTDNITSISDILLVERDEVESFAAKMKIIGDYISYDTRQIYAIHLGHYISLKYKSLESLKVLDKSYLPKPIYTPFS